MLYYILYLITPGGRESLLGFTAEPQKESVLAHRESKLGWSSLATRIWGTIRIPMLTPSQLTSSYNNNYLNYQISVFTQHHFLQLLTPLNSIHQQSLSLKGKPTTFSLPIMSFHLQFGLGHLIDRLGEPSKTLDGLDPFDVLGWDMPGFELQRRYPLVNLSTSLLAAQYRKIKAVIDQAQSQDFRIPYTIDHFLQTKALFEVPNGYRNVLADMADESRFHRYTRTWNLWWLRFTLSARIVERLDQAKDLYGDGCKLIPKTNNAKYIWIAGPCPSNCDSGYGKSKAPGHKGPIRLRLLLKLQECFECCDDRLSGEATALGLIEQRGV